MFLRKFKFNVSTKLISHLLQQQQVFGQNYNSLSSTTLLPCIFSGVTVKVESKENTSNTNVWVPAATHTVGGVIMPSCPLHAVLYLHNSGTRQETAQVGGDGIAVSKQNMKFV